MENEIKTEEKPKEEEPKFIAEAKEVSDRLEKAIKEIKDLQSFNILGGRSSVIPQQEKHEETAKEYAERVMNNKIKND